MPASLVVVEYWRPDSTLWAVTAESGATAPELSFNAPVMVADAPCPNRDGASNSDKTKVQQVCRMRVPPRPDLDTSIGGHDVRVNGCGARTRVCRIGTRAYARPCVEKSLDAARTSACATEVG